MGGKMLPVGIDIGAARARVALIEKRRDGSLSLRAVASRNIPDAVSSGERVHLLAALLEQMTEEIGVRGGRCVAAIGAPHALLNAVRFPRMSWAERVRAARFEAGRFTGWDMSSADVCVRVHPHGQEPGGYIVGAVRNSTLSGIMSVLKLARLRPVAIDYDGCALLRVCSADAIVDVGVERSSVHAVVSGGIASVAVECGGEHITRAIAEELAIDNCSAERRKRILGCAGAGEQARKMLALKIGSGVARLRERMPVARIALVGNGARLPGLAPELQDVLGAPVEVPVPHLLESDAYPEDVVRAAAPDWTLAASLAAWSAA